MESQISKRPPIHRSVGSPAYIAFARQMSATMMILSIIFTLVILLILGLVIGYLLCRGLTSINWDFFTKDPIPRGMDGYPGGMRNDIVGTLILIGMASLVGIPMGMLTGIFLSEYSARSKIASYVRFICDVLAGVPSIVVGILGYELLVKPLHGQNAFAGSLALAFIMVPIVARTTEEMLRLVPNSYREASIALGATKAWTILRVVVPAATGSIVTGVMLAVARVAGETAPLLFTVGMSNYLTVFRPPAPYVHPSDLHRVFPSLTVHVFNFATGPDRGQQRVAWAGILVLIMLIFAMNMAVRFALRDRQKR